MYSNITATRPDEIICCPDLFPDFTIWPMPGVRALGKRPVDHLTVCFRRFPTHFVQMFTFFIRNGPEVDQKSTENQPERVGNLAIRVGKRLGIVFLHAVAIVFSHAVAATSCIKNLPVHIVAFVFQWFLRPGYPKYLFFHIIFNGY